MMIGNKAVQMVGSNLVKSAQQANATIEQKLQVMVNQQKTIIENMNNMIDLMRAIADKLQLECEAEEPPTDDDEMLQAKQPYQDLPPNQPMNRQQIQSGGLYGGRVDE